MNATNTAGEVWTGEQETEAGRTWYNYLDAAGREYQSKEEPAYRISMDRAQLTSHGIAPIIDQRHDIYNGFNQSSQ